jgi:hypothetical protein
VGHNGSPLWPSGFRCKPFGRGLADDESVAGRNDRAYAAQPAGGLAAYRTGCRVLAIARDGTLAYRTVLRVLARVKRASAGRLLVPYTTTALSL